MSQRDGAAILRNLPRRIENFLQLELVPYFHNIEKQICMKYATELHDKYVIISLGEEKLTSIQAPQLKSAFVLLNAEGRRNILLDMTQVKYIDSSGLSALLRANSLCNGVNGIFVVFGITEHVEKLIKISQIDRVLNVLPTRQEAIEAVFMHEIEGELGDEGMEDDEEAEG